MIPDGKLNLKKEIKSARNNKYISFFLLIKIFLGIPLAVQWLRLHTSTAGCAGSIPGQGAKIPHAAWRGKKKKKKKDN